MSEYPHLILPRAAVTLERRKRPGFGSRPEREYGDQSQKVRVAVEGVIARREQAVAQGINPALVLKVRTAVVVPEEEWERAGLSILGTSENQTVILFATDGELQEFRRRLAEYAKGIPEGQKNPMYSSLIAAIEEIGPLGPEDRLGPRLRQEGFTSLQNFIDNAEYRFDVELWETGNQNTRSARVNELEAHIEGLGGEIVDRYIGRSLTLFRVRGTGAVIRWLLDLDDVASVEIPPTPDIITENLIDLTMGDLAEAPAPPEDASHIAILDSGIASGHPLARAAIGTTIGVPEHLGTADVKGHGTRVGGIALYCDVNACAEEGRFAPELVIHSAKVVNDSGQFDDVKLVPSLMREAMSALNQRGCRVFNISLGDPKKVFADGKPGPWTQVLDELSRELNVVITVSTGNYKFQPGGNPDRHISEYPGYLLGPESRLVEPAMAAIPLTVGSLARSASVPNGGNENVGLQPVAAVEEPSPFTRSGPGIGGALKPELCDFGGNLLFDGTAQSVTKSDGCSVMTLHHEYIGRLLTGAAGTSLAAPAVAHKAAQVFRIFPNASANLVRALLASSASVPSAAEERLRSFGEQAVRNVCGYGVPETRSAVTSDDNRAVLYAEGEIQFDYFYVYEIPIPREFVATQGVREITVTLAFDPPTRHTRVDYLGAKMSFRLVRGSTLERVTEHYRRRDTEEGPVPEFQGAVSDWPTPTVREKGTLQKATFRMSRNPANDYGDTYYLVVRCERRWATDDEGPQRFAVVVEMRHQTDIQLYERIRERVRERLRA